MAISAADKLNKTIAKRSQAIMSKINILYSRDGSVHPPIESLGDVDAFNLQMLFGASENENIDYTQMGIEGLIRCYYYIVQKLNGTTRSYCITNTTPNLSSIDQAATWLLAGTAYYSGFFGFPPFNDSLSQQQKATAQQGIFNTASTSFTDNGASGLAADTNNAITLMNALIAQVGVRGALGPHHGAATPILDPITGDPVLDPISGLPEYSFSGSITASGGIGTGIWGYRYTDVCPYYPAYYSGGGGQGGGGGTYFAATWGDGQRDATGETSSDGFVANRDYWDPTIITNVNNLISLLQTVNTYFGYAQVTNFNFFLSKVAIPGNSANYAPQITMVSQINTIISHLQSFLSVCGTYAGSSTPTANQAAVDAALDSLASSMSSDQASVNSVISTINSFFGSPTDSTTLYGQRYLLIKTMLDIADGSRTGLKGINTALTYMNQSIAAAEEQFGLFGIVEQTVPWTSAPTYTGGLEDPQIAGIETHSAVDLNPNSPTFAEMIIDGYLIAWTGTAHATAYDVWSSTDWNGTTGTWTHLLAAGNAFTITDIDLNSGKVLSYYVDTSIDPNAGVKPYYKIKAYDSGGTGDYSRIPAESVISDPHNIDDFASTGGGTTTLPGPSGPPPAAPGSAPPYLFKWTTQLNGLEALDNPINTTFQSEAAFDSIGSNLEVFVDGKEITQGNNPGQYRIQGSQNIILGTAVQNADTVTLIVYFGGSSSGGNWKAPVASIGALPTIGNSDGDVRLVVANQALYVWETAVNGWNEIKSSSTVSLAHTQLTDMPDVNGVNTDHDARYYNHAQVDAKIGVLQSEIQSLQYLVPGDAAPLAGDLASPTTTFYSGYLAAGSERFQVLQQLHYFTQIVNNPNIVIINSNSSTQFNQADQGTLELFVNGTLIDSFNLATFWSEANRQTGQTYPPFFGTNGRLEVLSVGPYLGYGSHQIGNFRVVLTAADLVPGENDVYVAHTVGTQTNQTNSFVVFYDNYTSAVNFSNVSVTEANLSSHKYLSGIRHYFTGDQLLIGFSAHALYDSTYVMTNQVTIDPTDFGINQSNVDHTSLGVQNFTTPQIGAILNYSAPGTITTTNLYSVSSQLSLTGRDPISASPTYQTSALNFLINTYSVQSDGKNEYFVDEHYRLQNDTYNYIPVSIVNQWNGQAALSVAQLQVFNSQLVYPSINFTSGYYPVQTVNYAGFSGVRYYFRAFVDLGVPHNNGVFTIQNFTIPDTKRKIELKLPSQTGWLDLTQPYNQATFAGVDGDGCLVGVNNNSFTWSSGGFSTALSGYMIVVRITMTDNMAVPIGAITIGW
jgi:hypothetical protein